MLIKGEKYRKLQTNWKKNLGSPCSGIIMYMQFMHVDYYYVRTFTL